MTTDVPTARDLVRDVFLAPPRRTDGTRWWDLVDLAMLAPKYSDRFEDDYPVPENNPQGQLFQMRLVIARQAAQDLKPNLKSALDTLRANYHGIRLTLHAHSQGAIVAAVAHNRLGEVPMTRVLEPSDYNYDQDTPNLTVPVAKQFHFISYGGGANMLDWGPNKYFVDYTHHVNNRDLVAQAVGMGDPFQRGWLIQGVTTLGALGQLEASSIPNFSQSVTTGFQVGTNSLLPVFFDSSQAPYAHEFRILAGPTPSEVMAWRAYHRVIWHIADTGIVPGMKHHDFRQCYACKIGTEDEPTQGIGTILWMRRMDAIGGTNPKEVIGRPDCLTGE